MERTLILIKPDGVRRGICGEIISRFERRGLIIQAMKMVCLSRDLAEKHYMEHYGKPFYPKLVDFITSGPVVAMVVGGPNAVKIVRSMMGNTNPADAAPGTIRGDYALSIDQNVIHGSDSETSASREISLFFARHELCD